MFYEDKLRIYTVTTTCFESISPHPIQSFVLGHCSPFRAYCPYQSQMTKPNCEAVSKLGRNVPNEQVDVTIMPA